MNKIARFVTWICSKFTRQEIEDIIKGLSDVLANRNPEVKPKDDFKEKHPNYRNFFVDSEPPLKAPAKPTPEANYKELLKDYEERYGKPFLPVKVKDPNNVVSNGTICKRCSAPSCYLFSMMARNVPRCDVRSVVAYPRYILVTIERPNTSALTVTGHFISGKRTKMFPSISAVMISARLTLLQRINLISEKDF